jgi:hypothetical protein
MTELCKKNWSELSASPGGLEQGSMNIMLQVCISSKVLGHSSLSSLQLQGCVKTSEVSDSIFRAKVIISGGGLFFCRLKKPFLRQAYW